MCRTSLAPSSLSAARQAEAPMPLPADGLGGAGVLWDLNEICPDEQARRQHGRDANRSERGQYDLELGALGLVVRLVAGARAEPPDAVGREEVDCDEHDAADPERDIDREVDRAPVRGERSEIPRTREMEYQRANNEQDDDDCKSHHTQTPPKTLGARSAVAVLMCSKNGLARCCGPLFDDQLAVHQHKVARKRAEISVVAAGRQLRSVEFH